MVFLAVALQSCEDDLRDFRIDQWAASDSQTVNGVTFTLTPCRAVDGHGAEFVSNNDFKIGEDVWIAVSIKNESGEPIYVYKIGEAGLDGSVAVYNYDGGGFVTGIRTSPAADFAVYIPGAEIADGELADGKFWGLHQHCWPGSMPERDPLVDPALWDGKPLASKGVYRAVLKKRLPVYKPDGQSSDPSEVLFTADLDLSVNFIVR